MKNYAEMTDFEINCLVAEATGHRPLISQYGWKGSQVGDYTKVIAIGQTERVLSTGATIR
ncbi:conserved domain protein (plasmid) [Yersinia pestis KIM D27]|nr:conserved domain protein [Yersinia pestis KIM D27]